MSVVAFTFTQLIVHLARVFREFFGEFVIRLKLCSGHIDSLDSDLYRVLGEVEGDDRELSKVGAALQNPGPVDLIK